MIVRQSGSNSKSVVEFDRVFFVSPRKAENRKVVITPTLAQYWLDHRHRGNRNLSECHVSSLARQMPQVWALTNQGIGFDWDGFLVDGQHRLSAVVKSGATVEMYVATGQDPTNRLLVDGGKKRTLADSYVMFGSFSNPKMAASAINTIRRHAYSGDPLVGKEAIEYSERFRAGIEWICSVAGKGDWERGPIVGATVFAYPASPKDIAAAYDDLKSGAIADRRDPMLAFRNWVTDGKRTGRMGGGAAQSEAFHKLLNALYRRIHGLKIDRGQIKAADRALSFFKGHN